MAESDSERFLAEGHLSTDTLRGLRARYTVSGMVPGFGGAYPPEIGITKRRDFKIWTPEGLDGPGLIDLHQAILSMSLGWDNPEVEAAIAKFEQELPGVDMVDTTQNSEAVLLLAQALVEAFKSYGNFRMHPAATGTGANNQAIRLCMGALGGEEATQLIVFGGSYGGADLAMNASCDATGWRGLTSLRRNALVAAIDGSNVEDVFRRIPFGKRPLLHVEDGQQGVAGFRVAPVWLMRYLMEQTHKGGGLAILDDVQALVRNGAGLLGFDRWADPENPLHKPDAVTLAKGLGNGRGVAAAMIAESVLEALNANVSRLGQPTGITFDTFNGPSAGLVAAREVVRIVLQHQLWKNMRTQGATFTRNLGEVAVRCPDIVETVIGEGGLIGVQLKTAEQVKRAFEVAPDKGIYFAKGGTGSNAGRVLRTPLPFNATDELVAEASQRLEDVLKAAA